MVTCRACGSADLHPVLDLGTAPPSNAYLTAEQARGPETWLPLRMNVCKSCWLMQTEDFVTGADVFTSDYAYYSSMSESWLEHARTFVAEAVHSLSLGPESFVVEVASNDGYLLQYVREIGIRCLGIEPTYSTATAAESRGLKVEREFLTEESARRIVNEYGEADLVIANNVIAHVPDIVDFTRGLALLLKPSGTLSLEFAYGVNLICEGQFDTVYHEHFSYLTLSSLNFVLAQAGLIATEVTSLTTHGGSLRVLAQRDSRGQRTADYSVDLVLERESRLGVRGTDFYSSLQGVAYNSKMSLLSYLISRRRHGQKVVGYGAAAKGNTLLNFAGVRGDLLPWIADKSPGKIGRMTPGSRIPIIAPDELQRIEPDSVLILPWNLSTEIITELRHVVGAKVELVVPVPEVKSVS